LQRRILAVVDDSDELVPMSALLERLWGEASVDQGRSTRRAVARLAEEGRLSTRRQQVTPGTSEWVCESFDDFEDALAFLLTAPRHAHHSGLRRDEDHADAVWQGDDMHLVYRPKWTVVWTETIPPRWEIFMHRPADASELAQANAADRRLRGA
jgi:hypothetical protein